MQVKNQQLESDMEQETGSKLGKKYINVVYSQPRIFTGRTDAKAESPILCPSM